ncbi:hypothetical protein ATCC90586_000150 [Pythium insidiosum]|nr:hypothetical protein ATCC90586_000150 [Pythium insidiosum]
MLVHRTALTTTRRSTHEALEPDDRRAPPHGRWLSLNCRNLRKFGPRLQVRRRQRRTTATRLLTEDVERVRETIRALDERLALLDSISLTRRQNAETAVVSVLRTYYHHMQRGFHPSAVPYDQQTTQPFLRCVFTPDVRCQDFSGIDMFFQQWEFVTKFHAGVTMRNDTIHVLSAEDVGDESSDDEQVDEETEDEEQQQQQRPLRHRRRRRERRRASEGADARVTYVIKTTGTTTCRISRDTLVHFFPHILQDETLVQTLVGKEYEYGFTTIFHVNEAGRVFQFESQIDLATGLLSLLQDPFVTVKMIESSQWTKAGNLRGTALREEQVEIQNGVIT